MSALDVQYPYGRGSFFGDDVVITLASFSR